MNTTITRPADLDPSRHYSPAQVRLWKAEVAAYHQTLREEDASRHRKEEAAEASRNRVLSEDEYYALTLKRLAEAQAKEAKREAAERAEQEAEAAYLACMPDLAEVLESTEYHFMLKLQHWFQQGYELTDDSIRYFVPGCYAVSLRKPATIKRSK